MSVALGKKQKTRRVRVRHLKNSGNGQGEMAQQANRRHTSTPLVNVSSNFPDEMVQSKISEVKGTGRIVEYQQRGCRLKKNRLYTIAVCSVIIALQCGVNNSNVNSKGLVIQGRIATASLMRSGLSKSSAAGVVQKVLVYRDFGDAELAPVDTDGTFAVAVQRKACGFIFLDASNSIMGYLSLASGLEALPIMMVDSTIDRIDLKSVTIQDSIGTPSENPLGVGGPIEMTAEELGAYKLQAALFSTIIRNLDMNNDNVIDVLSDRPYWFMCTADFSGGIAATSNPDDSGALPTLNVFHFNFSDYHLNAGTAQADLMTPDGLHFAQPETGLFTFMKNGKPSITATMYHWVLQNTSWSSFISGRYSIAYDADKHIAFTVTSPLNAENYIVAANLWYEKDGGKITKVHWKWKMQNGSAIDATRLLQKDVNLQFNYSSGVARQGNYHITSADVECRVNEDVDLLRNIGLFCNDLFGNQQITNYSVR
jgi:hypothetical protein